MTENVNIDKVRMPERTIHQQPHGEGYYVRLQFINLSLQRSMHILEFSVAKTSGAALERSDMVG